MDEPEEWRKIPMLAGVYEASSLGRIRRRSPPRAGRMISQNRASGGYLKCAVCVDGIEMQSATHRFVADAFIGPIPDGHVVNHKDGIKTNNKPSNLEYVTPAGNSAHAVSMGFVPRGIRSGRYTKPERTARGERVNTAKLTAVQVVELRAAWDDGATLEELMSRFGLGKSGTWAVATRINWRHVK